MTHPDSVYERARALFERFDAPTVAVPVGKGGQTGVWYAAYRGDEDWMKQARLEENQVLVAVACCRRAYADARGKAGAHGP